MAIKVNNTTIIDNSRNLINSTGIEVSGIVTASPGAAITYYGDGSNLTGVSGSAEFNDINAGIITASAYDGFVVSGTKLISDDFEFGNDKSNLSFAETIEVSPGVAFTVSIGTTITTDPFSNIEPETLELPSGTTEERQGTPSTGALRYNTDLNAIEVYIGTEWRQVELEPSRRGKAITGVLTPSLQGPHQIESFNINTGGQCFYFGNLSFSRSGHTTCGNSTRSLFGGGRSSTIGKFSLIDYVTIATEGDAVFFGDLTEGRFEFASLSNSVYGIFSGGLNPSLSSTIDTVTIATAGDAIDFADSLQNITTDHAGCASPIRGLFAGGVSPGVQNRIDYVNIASKGTTNDFGLLTETKSLLSACSSHIRGLFAGGQASPTTVRDTIEYVTIASAGNAIDFGDLVYPKRQPGTTSNSIRGVFIGGDGAPTPDSRGRTEIEFVTISSLGNSTIYGTVDKSMPTERQRVSTSDSHGGLG